MTEQELNIIDKVLEKLQTLQDGGCHELMDILKSLNIDIDLETAIDIFRPVEDDGVISFCDDGLIPPSDQGIILEPFGRKVLRDFGSYRAYLENRNREYVENEEMERVKRGKIKDEAVIAKFNRRIKVVAFIGSIIIGVIVILGGLKELGVIGFQGQQTKSQQPETDTTLIQEMDGSNGQKLSDSMSLSLPAVKENEKE